MESKEECKVAQSVKIFSTVKQFMSFLDNSKEQLVVKGGKIYDTSGNIKGLFDEPKRKGVC